MKSSSRARASGARTWSRRRPVTQVTAADVVTAGRYPHRRPRQPAAAGLRGAERDGFQRRDGHCDAEPARPRLEPDARPDRRPPHAVRRRAVGGRRARHQPDPDLDDRARRHPDRRRIRGLRLGRRRRRRQLHHEEGLRGRASSRSQYNMYWHENDFSGPGATKLRDVIADSAATNPSEFALPDDTVTDGERQGALADGRRQQRRRSRQPHGLCHGVRQRRHPAGGSRLSPPAPWTPTRSTRSSAAARPRTRAAASRTSNSSDVLRFHDRYGNCVPRLQRAIRTRTTSARSTTTSAPSAATASARWVTTSLASTRTSTPS
mgnify:CR=1 FL=1